MPSSNHVYRVTWTCNTAREAKHRFYVRNAYFLASNTNLTEFSNDQESDI